MHFSNAATGIIFALRTHAERSSVQQRCFERQRGRTELKLTINYISRKCNRDPILPILPFLESHSDNLFPLAVA